MGACSESGTVDRHDGGAVTENRYPHELESDVELGGDRTLRLRPIRPDDMASLDTFHHRLSPESVYRRYFGLHPELSDDELRHLTQVDYVDRLALIVEDENDLVAVGRYDRYPGTSDAEVAFVVRDDYQHLGLGSYLLHRLAQAARARGVTRFRAETLATNQGMLAVFLHSGFHVTTSASSGEISVRFALDPDCDATDATVGRRA
jgi:GNAT superfamily N-acetyltransferase